MATDCTSGMKPPFSLFQNEAGEETPVPKAQVEGENTKCFNVDAAAYSNWRMVNLYAVLRKHKTDKAIRGNIYMLVARC